MVDRSVFDLRLAKLEQLLQNLEPLTAIERSDFLADQAVQAHELRAYAAEIAEAAFGAEG